MTFFACRRLFDAQCSQRDTLVNLDVVADDRRFADDHAGAVVNEEPITDGRAGMDVYAGLVMDVFAHNTRQQWHILLIKKMNKMDKTQRTQIGQIVKNRLADFLAGSELSDLIKAIAIQEIQKVKCMAKGKKEKAVLDINKIEKRTVKGE